MRLVTVQMVFIRRKRFLSHLSRVGPRGAPYPSGVGKAPGRTEGPEDEMPPPPHWGSGQEPRQTWTTHWKWTFIESGNLKAWGERGRENVKLFACHFFACDISRMLKEFWVPLRTTNKGIWVQVLVVEHWLSHLYWTNEHNRGCSSRLL